MTFWRGDPWPRFQAHPPRRARPCCLTQGCGQGARKEAPAPRRPLCVEDSWFACRLVPFSPGWIASPLSEGARRTSASVTVTLRPGAQPQLLYLGYLHVAPVPCSSCPTSRPAPPPGGNPPALPRHPRLLGAPERTVFVPRLCFVLFSLFISCGKIQDSPC